MGVVDNWQVAGLQGTGSIDVMLDDIFVPDYRTQRLQDNFLLKGAGQAVNASSLYRVPFGQIFGFDRWARCAAGHADRPARL